MGECKLLIKTIDSLHKVFADEAPIAKELESASFLIGERYSYQIAYCYSGGSQKNVQVKVKTNWGGDVKVHMVGLISCDMPIYANRHDDNILRGVPGLYPDPLFELQPLRFIDGQWRSLWVELDGTGSSCGQFDIEVEFISQKGEILGTSSMSFAVIDAKLPTQELIYTCWLHADCIADWYKVDVFSDKHWELWEKYIAMAVKYGMNMLLTPIFTPPLDTVVGGERLTVQLVDVFCDDGKYSFGFSNLIKFIQMAKRNGIKYFEMCHLFTQWGAKHAPKIVVHVNGKLQRIFGWETDAVQGAYVQFLQVFLPQLCAVLEAQAINKCTYFHISDEPSIAHIENYKAAKAVISDILTGYPIIDALSDFSFYEMGAVTKPIPANDHIETFAAHGIDGLWTYYCCSQSIQVSNRFIDMPSARNRILGYQLYKYDLEGFLHWGFNYYNDQYSEKQINPYVTTSADGFVPSGDPFVVYPGSDEPIASLRLIVFHEALQDLRALKALEAKIGRDAVIHFIEDGLTNPISMTCYPIDSQWILDKREALNRLL